MLEIKRGSWVGPYKVIKPLEEEITGAMATLFLAQLVQPEGTQLVVLKVVPEEEGAEERINALRKEVEILRKLRHPNIIKVYPIPSRKRGEFYISRATNVPGKPWFCALEYLKGGSLRTRLQELGSLPLEEAVEIAYQIGSALDYMHSKGYVHWDVKPENISFRYELSEEGKIEAVLTDFGIARGTHEPAEVTGTVDYMSPERLKVHMGEIPPDQITDQRPADVYALGVVLYEMLTGSLPFVGEDKESLKYAILEEQPIPLTDFKPDVPAVIEDVIFQALEKDPAERPTMEEMVTMLDRAAPLIRIGIRRPPAPPPKERVVEEEKKERKEEEKPKASPIRLFLKWAFAIALVAALAMALFIGWEWAHGAHPPWQPTPTPIVVAPATPTPNLTVTALAMEVATAQAERTAAAQAAATATAEWVAAATATAEWAATTTAEAERVAAATATAQWMATATAEAKRAAALAVARATPTPPLASPPTLISPGQGDTHYGTDPVEFRWTGTLSSGQTFQVRARSSRTGFEVKSPPLSTTSWAAKLPEDSWGEWRWRVSVLWRGSELVTSDERLFWFQPHRPPPGGGGGITPPPPP